MKSPFCFLDPFILYQMSSGILNFLSLVENDPKQCCRMIYGRKKCGSRYCKGSNFRGDVQGKSMNSIHSTKVPGWALIISTVKDKSKCCHLNEPFFHRSTIYRLPSLVFENNWAWKTGLKFPCWHVFAQGVSLLSFITTVVEASAAFMQVKSIAV